MVKIPTKYLLLVNGLLWTAIGIKIALYNCYLEWNFSRFTAQR